MQRMSFLFALYAMIMAIAEKSYPRFIIISAVLNYLVTVLSDQIVFPLVGVLLSGIQD